MLFRSNPGHPLDAAEAALKASGGRADAVAVVSGGRVLAVAGQAEANWDDKVDLRGGALSADPHVAYVVVAGDGSQRLIAATRSLQTVIGKSSSLVVTRGGRILTSSNPALAGSELRRLGVGADQVTAAAGKGQPVQLKPEIGRAHV